MTIPGISISEAAALTNGASFWATKPIGAHRGVVFSDGPNGVRAQDETVGADHMGLRPSKPATCFPPAVALSQTWDPELVRRVGVALGVEAASAGVDVLNGPGVNIKRDPRGGRNFEYYSEDPYLTGSLATAVVDGLQSQGVGAGLKHFAANNTEHERFRTSSEIDQRTLREIYLRAFQRVVEDAAPWTVMCSYNRINGVPAAENRWLLTDVLRGEWGFDGLVVSDWGAVDDRAVSIPAGIDLAMPGGDTAADEALAVAAESGSLDSAVLERAASAVIELSRRAEQRGSEAPAWDCDSHHALAREVAARSIVLLKNDGDLLPLASEGSIAVVGEMALVPRYQGGGSAAVVPTRVDVPLDELRASAPSARITYAAGYGTSAAGAELTREAVATAAASDVAVLFLGIPNGQESEGFDRDDIELPADQVDLLRAVVDAQPRTVVVLAHGNVLRLAPVVESAAAILDGALLGQGGGGAIADVLFGLVNPSGRLTETVPERIQDVPAYGSFPGEKLHTRYAEGVLVGYRWYDFRDLAVTYPFGHGLSYTTFEYSDLQVAEEPDGLSVSVTVRNTGARTGRETVQVYIGINESSVTRAPLELKGFSGIELSPGEGGTATVHIRRADLAYWDVAVGAWVVEPGRYRVAVGASSRDIRVDASIPLTGDDTVPRLTFASSVAEVIADPIAGPEIRQIMTAMFGGPKHAESGVDMFRMIGSTPVGRFAGSLGQHLTREQLSERLAEANRRNGYPG